MAAKCITCRGRSVCSTDRPLLTHIILDREGRRTMTALRSTLARLATAFGIFALSIAVVVATPTNAQALQAPPAPPTISPSKGFKFGRVIPGPVGWVITAGSLGWAAYENKDTIVKWFGGDPDLLDEYFGAGDGTGQGGPTSWGNSGSDTRTMTRITSVSGRTVQFEMTCQPANFYPNMAGMTDKRCQPAGGVTYRFNSPGVAPYEGQALMSCRNAAGHTYTTSTGLTKLHSLYGANVSTITFSATFCGTGETLEGLRLPPHPDGQTYGLAWGSLLNGLDGSSIGIKQLDVTVWCKNVETDAVQTISHTTPGNDMDNVVIPSCKARLGDAWVMTKVRIQPVIDPDTLPEDVPLWDVPDMPPLEWDEEIPDEVQPCEKSRQGCSLSVWIDNDPCDASVPVCRNWTKVLENNPSRVKCRYGVNEVAMKHCRALGGDAYRPDAKTRVDKENPTKPDPNPTQPRPDDPPTPQPAPPVAPPIPNPDNPDSTDNCLEAMVSLNPVDWVFTPVKCAFQWAFVPKTSFKARVQNIRTAFAAKAPFSFFAGLGDLSAGVGGGDCPTNWKARFQGRDYPLLCGTAMEAGVRGARPFVTALVLAAAAFPFVRSMVYAAFPVLKPTPTGSD